MAYSMNKRIDNNSNLAAFLNEVLKSTNVARIMCSPRIFQERDKRMRKESKKNTQRFYQLVLFEMYSHALVSRLNEWVTNICEYIREFNGSWEYYARSKRLSSIDEYGGNPDDYNEDGTIKVDVGHDKLKSYSIISELIYSDNEDLVQDTNAQDLYWIYTFIRANGSFCITDIFKGLKTYKCVDGEMVENNLDDNVFRKVSRQQGSEDMCCQLFSIITLVNRMVNELSKASHTSDNKELLGNVLFDTQAILDMNYLFQLLDIIEESNK